MNRYTFPRFPTQPLENHAAARRFLRGRSPCLRALSVNPPTPGASAPPTNLILVVGERHDRLGEKVVEFYRWKGGRFTCSTQGVAARHLLPAPADHQDMGGLLTALSADRDIPLVST